MGLSGTIRNRHFTVRAMVHWCVQFSDITMSIQPNPVTRSGSCKVTLTTVGKQRISIQEVLDLTQATTMTCVASKNPALGGTAHLNPRRSLLSVLAASIAKSALRYQTRGGTLLSKRCPHLHLAGLQAPVGLFPRPTQGLALLTLLLVGSLDILSLVMESSCGIQERSPFPFPWRSPEKYTQKSIDIEDTWWDAIARLRKREEPAGS